MSMPEKYQCWVSTCAAPTGLAAPREYGPTTPVVGYVVSSLAGLERDAPRNLHTDGISLPRVPLFRLWGTDKENENVAKPTWARRLLALIRARGRECRRE
jgi:hypothetical protein